MSVQSELDELRQIVSADKISDLSIEQLERYSIVLCFSHASDYFADRQFSQVCETIRMLWLAREADKSTQKTIELTKETKDFTRQLLYLTWAITIFTAVMIFQNVFEYPKIPIFGSQKVDHATHYATQEKQPNEPKPTIPTIKQ